MDSEVPFHQMPRLLLLVVMAVVMVDVGGVGPGALKRSYKVDLSLPVTLRHK